MAIEFQNTVRGRKFFDGDLPRLTAAIESLAVAMAGNAAATQRLIESQQGAPVATDQMALGIRPAAPHVLEQIEREALAERAGLSAADADIVRRGYDLAGYSEAGRRFMKLYRERRAGLVSAPE